MLKLPPTCALLLVSAFLWTTTSLSVCQDGPKKLLQDNVVPGTEWARAVPETVGYSTRKLDALRTWLKTQDTGSLMVIAQGRVIFSYGDVSHTSKIASVRKSVLDMLYGAELFKNQINDSVLNQSVEQLGLDDKQPFLPIEQKAVLIQLMAARSGIFLPSGDSDQAKVMPPRGSEYPGSYFMYNNWDFNALGTAFEKLAHKSIFQALNDDLAEPIGMEDFSLDKQKKISSQESVHPEYAMYLSTRDMARLGLLMLDCGQWNGKIVLSCDFARYSTYLHTPFRDINPTGLRNYAEPARWGYGLLWWVWDAPEFPGGTYIGAFQGAYSAMGTGGQYITVIPTRNLVVVHQVDIDQNPHANVSPSSYMAMLLMVNDAYCGEDCK